MSIDDSLESDSSEEKNGVNHTEPIPNPSGVEVPGVFCAIVYTLRGNHTVEVHSVSELLNRYSNKSL